MKRIQPHIRCGEGDIGEFVLLCGDPGRVDRIAERLSDVREVGRYRGFRVITGWRGGRRISAASTGIGSPSAALVCEELANIGARVFIRVGTTGALQPHVEIGDLIIPFAAVRAEGTTRNYIPLEFPAVASPEVFQALVEAAQELKVRFHAGVVVTSDTFYLPPKDEYRNCALSVEMECAAVFILGSLRGIKAGAILAVDSSLPRNIPKEELAPEVQEAIGREIEIALKALDILSRGAGI